MNPITLAINGLFDQIPRRHSAENLAAINLIISEYDELLISIEAINSYWKRRELYARFGTAMHLMQALGAKSIGVTAFTLSNTLTTPT
jgi:hypothetical protein